MEKYGVVLEDEKTKTGSAARACPKCGTALPNRENMCPNCGTEPFEKRPTVPPPEKK